MLEYPSIMRDPIFGGPYLVWDKLDGQNVRAEWSRKRGFYKLGARRTHLPDEYRAEVQQLIGAQQDSLLEVFRRQRWDRATCFFEYYGFNSFAGVHKPNEPRMIALFDVAGPNDQLLDPRDFHKLFHGKVQTPNLLWQGNFNKEDAVAVREGRVEGMTFEGVIVKGPAQKKDSLPVMFKIKNQAWIDKVKALYGAKADQYL